MQVREHIGFFESIAPTGVTAEERLTSDHAGAIGAAAGCDKIAVARLRELAGRKNEPSDPQSRSPATFG